MQFLKKAAAGNVKGGEGRKVQVILSTHSPNLASGLPVANTILLDGNSAHPLSEEHTNLSTNDYSFLERFFNVTKANLFFAHGVLIVEGDGEAQVLPAIARALKLDLDEHGVSIVNVKGTGLWRFSKIFQRADEPEAWISIPVACLADMDIMPDAAPEILGIVNDDEDPKWDNPKRRWKAKRDLGPDSSAISAALLERIEHLKRDDAQNVKTFVSDHWTLEYDLARCGLAYMVFEVAQLANAHDAICASDTTPEAVIATAAIAFDELLIECVNDTELIAINVYQLFKSKKASKAIAAQYLAAAIDRKAAEDRGGPSFSTSLQPC